MTPIVRVIAHTTFLGVPPDLLPIEKVKKQQEERYTEDTQDTKAAHDDQLEQGRNLRYALPKREAYLSDRVIEAEARRLVAAAGQDRGTDAERLIECAGRACYDSYGNGRNSADYHKHILDVNHGSVMEHTNLTFFLGNISRGCTHELVRHRVGIAISQRSTRYVDESESPWIDHPLMVAYCEEKGTCPAVHVRGTKHDSQMLYEHVVGMLQAWLVEKGTDKFTARKQARGAARGYLGNALCTEMVWTCNLRALRGIIDQRVKAAADAEIRILFGRIWEEARNYAPAYLQYEKRTCPDGLGFELFDPKSPAERLKAAEAEIQRLTEQVQNPGPQL